MTEPSEAALQKACEVLGHAYTRYDYYADAVMRLARYLDTEDKAAREARDSGEVWPFVGRHILPDPNPTLRSILLDESLNVEAKERALRDAGLLREEAP